MSEDILKDVYDSYSEEIQKSVDSEFLHFIDISIRVGPFYQQWKLENTGYAGLSLKEFCTKLGYDFPDITDIDWEFLEGN